ncbi:MAG: phytoene/squalene synthase family protein [Phycisphaeraceae bacterium]
MTRISLEQSEHYCEQVTRQRARNFYYGMKLTPGSKGPGSKRFAMYAIYAWMRLADDLADAAPGSGVGNDDAAKTASLEKFRDMTMATLDGGGSGDGVGSGGGGEMPGDEVWPAFIDTVKRYEIPRQYLADMIDGQLMDMRVKRYATFDALYDYCYKVASVVGLTCIEVWGYDGGERTRKLAEHRGIAFQLTNILRDVREDAGRDRVYLPGEDFDVFELTPSMFLFGEQAEAMAGLRKTVARADQYFRGSEELDRLVHRDGKACLWAMTEIYRGIFEKIRRDPAAVLRDKRIRLSSMRKGWIALRARGKAAI